MDIVYQDRLMSPANLPCKMEKWCLVDLNKIQNFDVLFSFFSTANPLQGYYRSKCQHIQINFRPK